MSQGHLVTKAATKQMRQIWKGDVQDLEHWVAVDVLVQTLCEESARLE
jgi:hypothetical protein